MGPYCDKCSAPIGDDIMPDISIGNGRDVTLCVGCYQLVLDQVYESEKERRQA